jgi:hypothetical protein
MNKLKEELKDLYVKNGYRLDFDLMWLWINQNYISKEQILNLECLKEESGEFDQFWLANQLRKEIKDEIKKL